MRRDWSFYGLFAQVEQDYTAKLKEIWALIDELSDTQARTLLKIVLSREDTDRTMAMLISEIMKERK